MAEKRYILYSAEREKEKELDDCAVMKRLIIIDIVNYIGGGWHYYTVYSTKQFRHMPYITSNE